MESVGLFEPQPNSINPESIWDRANKLRKYIIEECRKSESIAVVLSDEQTELIMLRKEFKIKKSKTKNNSDQLLKVGILDDSITTYKKNALWEQPN